MKKELNQIRVDIILPNYNSAPYLPEIIDSIINQTFKNWKLIIIDANSNIETKKILKKYDSNPNINIIWLKKNKRAGFCRNLAIRNSKSEYESPHTEANACSVMTPPDANIIQHQVWPSISLLFSTCSPKSPIMQLRAS